MKRVIYTCPYVPAEWIAAHGLHPSRIMPNAHSIKYSYVPIEGVCPYLRAFVNEAAADTSAVIFTTVCDQMRRGFDIISQRCKKPAFLMNVPKTWQNVNSHKLYIDELKRLGRFLVEIGGRTPSKTVLIDMMIRYDSIRASIRSARGCSNPRRYSEMIAEFNYNDPFNISDYDQIPFSLNGKERLAILGGPLLREDFEIFDVIEHAGGQIVLDATETGERGICARFDRQRMRENPMLELSDAYFGHIPDAFRRPNSQLYNWLKEELPSRSVQGIIYRRYIWCDTWHAELARLRQWTALPVLDIDVNGDGQTMPAQMTKRIYAFLETLQ